MTDTPKTEEDWIRQVPESGFAGSVTMVSDREDGRNIRQVALGDSAASEFNTKIPGELIPHVAELLRERDRMVAAAMKASIEIPNDLQELHLASLKASCLHIAIDVIRKKYEEHDNGTTAERDGRGERPGDAGGTEAPRTTGESETAGG